MLNNNKDPVEEIVLNELMREYHETVVELENDCYNINAEIARWTEVREVLAKPHQEKLAELEAQMRLPMLARQSSFVCSFGKIDFRKGAVRRTWNLDSLDMVCAAKPEIKEAIWMFRDEKTGDPSITVKLAEPI